MNNIIWLKVFIDSFGVNYVNFKDLPLIGNNDLILDSPSLGLVLFFFLVSNLEVPQTPYQYLTLSQNGEVCLGYGFILFFILLIFLFIILILVFQLNFCPYNIFSRKYLRLVFFITFVIILNFFLLLTNNLVILLACLVFTSCYSFYLVLKEGYGVSFEVGLVLIFKVLGDLLIMFCLGSGLNMSERFSNQEIMDVNFNRVNGLESWVVLIPFLIYSLFGFFGFWIYWAMDANHFVSMYLHSVGFISIGVLFVGKLFYLGILEGGRVLDFLVSVSIIGHIFFLLFGLFVKDLKKSYGYFSSSSLSVLTFYVLISPTFCFFYMILSSMVKIFSFTLIGCCGKVKTFENGVLKINVWFFFLLFILKVSLYSMEFFFIFDYFKNFLGYCFLSNFLILLFSIKFLYLLMFFNRLFLQNFYIGREGIKLGSLFIFFFIFIFSLVQICFFYLFNFYIKFHLGYFLLVLTSLFLIGVNQLKTLNRAYVVDNTFKFLTKKILFFMLEVFYSTNKVVRGIGMGLSLVGAILNKVQLPTFKVGVGDLVFFVFLFLIILTVFIF